MKHQKTVEQLATEAPSLFHKYIEYLESERGLMSGTIHNRKGPLVEFFKHHRWLETHRDAKRLSPTIVQKYVRENSANLSLEKR